MKGKQKIEFAVLKKITKYYPCSHCDESGQVKRTFRKMTFVSDCPACKGKGYVPHVITEEAPFSEAMESIKTDQA